jgi:hypothetical protein
VRARHGLPLAGRMATAAQVKEKKCGEVGGAQSKKNSTDCSHAATRALCCQVRATPNPSACLFGKEQLSTCFVLFDFSHAC